MINPQNNIDENLEVPENEEIIEDIDEIVEDISRQNQYKRDRTAESEKIEKNKKIKKQTRWDENSSPDESDADAEVSKTSRKHKKILNSTMKTVKNNENDETIPSDSQTLPENTDPMRQITHYFSVPETPRIPVQPTGRKPTRKIPETPENQIGEKQKCKDPASGNKNEQSYLMNRNINTQDDIIIQEMNNESKNLPTDNE